jgi:hypothetical protein
VLVVDDQILFRVLAHRVDSQLEHLIGSGVVTTSSWYFRLARAVSADEGGVLSQQVRSLPEDEQPFLRNSIDRLPLRVQTLDPRDIVPLMASIATVSPANFLTLEAIATAVAPMRKSPQPPRHRSCNESPIGFTSRFMFFELSKMSERMYTDHLRMGVLSCSTDAINVREYTRRNVRRSLSSTNFRPRERS